MSAARRRRGFLLAFEGIEGCGKSTQLKRLASRLRTLGYLVVETREPGGGPVGEQIRAVLLDVANRGMTPRCELLLYLASRAQHVGDIIRPALEKGAVVLCDRFSDATVAYQGFGRAMTAQVVRRLNQFATEGLTPDLTLVLDVPVMMGLERKRHAGGLDRLDLEREAFHEAVRKGYLRIAKQEPRRVRVIDGTTSIPDVSQTVQRIAIERLQATKNHLTRVESHAV